MTISISRHYLTIADGKSKRRVHYRRAGKGPPLLMVHQSPRSSAEYEPLMLQWGEHFTCIAPDTPGFGQSQPLDTPTPDINDYADAIAAFARALGLEHTAAYGFHSGAIILITALRRHPTLFTAIGAGGYGVWTEEERQAFGASYTPPFLPTAYGEHLVWAWNRVLEQSWFFPWYDARPETRLPRANDDPAQVDSIVREILDAGDSFRLGYAAVLQAPRDIPPTDAKVPPVLITAYDGDPLQAHIDRMGELPTGWEARKLRSPEEQQAQNLAFLMRHAAPGPQNYAQDGDRGFVEVSAIGFEGLIHWHGERTSDTMTLPPPGSEADLVEAAGTIVIDPPGHGLSSSWSDQTPEDLQSWQTVLEAAAAALGATKIVYPQLPKGDPTRLFTDLTPDRFGHYLVRAWAQVRAAHFFSPWYEARAENALLFDPSKVTPERLALEHRALIRARSARGFMISLSNRSPS